MKSTGSCILLAMPQNPFKVPFKEFTDIIYVRYSFLEVNLFLRMSKLYLECPTYILYVTLLGIVVWPETF